jgi:hypothetical protein
MDKNENLKDNYKKGIFNEKRFIKGEVYEWKY